MTILIKVPVNELTILIKVSVNEMTILIKVCECTSTLASYIRYYLAALFVLQRDKLKKDDDSMDISNNV
jgi:hypothetical protein